MLEPWPEVPDDEEFVEGLVEVAVFDNLPELYLAQGLLKAAGIRSFRRAERHHRRGAAWAGWRELFVKHSDLDQARAILKSSRVSDEELAAQAEAAVGPDEENPGEE